MSDLTEQEIDALRRVHQAVPSPFVIVGGWAGRLLRRHPLAVLPEHEALLTEDLDIASPADSSQDDSSVGSALQAAGFVAQYSGESRPPVARYELKGFAGFELEFIAPLLGPERHRTGETRATVELSGVTAQLIRHVELLLLEPCLIPVDEIDAGAQFRVVNPASFVMQRLLVLPNRPRLAKKGKDALYIFDALQLFTHAGQVHPDVVRIASRVWESLTRKQMQQIRKTQALLEHDGSEAVTEAVRIARQTLRPQAPSAREFTLVCKHGLSELIPG